MAVLQLLEQGRSAVKGLVKVYSCLGDHPDYLRLLWKGLIRGHTHQQNVLSVFEGC